MSTSEQNYDEDSAARLTEGLPLNENSIGQAASLPDVAMLARMANEFFRVQPSSAFPTGAASSVPDASYAGSAFETRLPQLGMPLPSVPSIPSAGAPGMPGMSCSRVVLRRSGADNGSCSPARRPSRRECRNMTPAAHPLRFRRRPSRYQCLSLTTLCSRLSQPVCPRSRRFSPLRTEDDAKSALTANSPFYFLEHAAV